MPRPQERDYIAFRVFNLCANGMGGIDWNAVPMWCGALGITDVEDLMHRLAVMKLHRKPKEQS